MLALKSGVIRFIALIAMFGLLAVFCMNYAHSISHLKQKVYKDFIEE